MAAARTTQIVLTGTNASALKAINEVGAAADRNAKHLGTTFERSTSKVGGLFTKLDRQLAGFGVPLTGALGAVGTKLEQSGTKADTFGKKLSNLGGGVALGAAAGLALVGGAAIHAALEGERAQARLDTAIKNTGQNSKVFADRIDSLNDKMAGFGFENDDVANSLARLIPATHDTGKAIQDVALAADIAKARGLDLVTATDLLTKVEQGRYTQLTRLGVASTEQVKTFKTTNDAIRFLSNTYKGSAAAAADTYQGKLEALSARAHNLEEELGNKLLPVVADGVGVLLTAAHGFETVNDATDGWLGKLTLAAASVPVAVFAIDKLGSGLSALIGAYGKAAAAVGLKSRADVGAIASQDTLAASQLSSVGAVQAAEVAQAQLVVAEEAQVLAADKAAAATARYEVALATFAAEEHATAEAAGELVAANAAVEASQTKLAAANAKLASARVGAELADDLALAAPALENAQLAANDLGVSVAGVAPAAGVAAASLATVAAALAIPAAGLAFFLKMKHDVDEADKKIRALAEDIVKTRSAVSQAKLGTIIGPDAAKDIAHYSDLLLANASAQDLNTAKSVALRDAIAQLPGTEQQHADALNLASDSASTGAARNADYARSTLGVQNAVGQATGAMDDLVKKYGEAGVQTLALQAAQKDYADALATGTASEADLASKREAVVAASEKQTKTQDKVTAATQEGSDAAHGNADALDGQTSSTQKAEDALRTFTDALTGARDAQLGTRSAVLDVSDALDGYNEKAKTAVEKGGQSAEANRDWERASIQVRRSIDDVAQAAKTQAEQQALVTGKTLTAAGAAKAQKDKLVELRNTIAPNSPFRAYLDSLITDLDNAAKKRSGTLNYEIHLTAGGRVINDPGSVQRLAKGGVPTLRAKGGRIGRSSGSVIVGEEGRELLIGQRPGRADHLATVTPIQNARTAVVLGEGGEGLYLPEAPGIVVPHPLTEKILAHRELDSADLSALQRLGVGEQELEQFYGPISHRASGGPVGGAVTVSFHKGSSGSVPDSVSQADQALSSFVDTALGRVPDAQSAISDFASSVKSDMDDVKSATEDADKATRAYWLASAAEAKQAKKVHADELDLLRLVKGHADALHIEIATERLDKDRDKLKELHGATTEAKTEFTAAAKAEQTAEKTLKKQLDPAGFTRAILGQASKLKVFETALKRLLGDKDDDLARALATAGPDDAFGLATAFAGNLTKARQAERALEAQDKQSADYSKFLHDKLGITLTPKAAGGPVQSDKLYVVGERGPELFKPAGSGAIIPNHRIQTGPRWGGNIQIVLKEETHVDPITGRVLRRLIIEDQKLNGPWSGVELVA